MINNSWATRLYDELVGLHDKVAELDNLIQRDEGGEKIDVGEIQAVFDSLNTLLNSEYWTTILKKHEDDPREALWDGSGDNTADEPYYGDAIDFYKAVKLFHATAMEYWFRFKRMGGQHTLFELTGNGSDYHLMTKIERLYEDATSFLIYDDSVMEHAKQRTADRLVKMLEEAEEKTVHVTQPDMPTKPDTKPQNPAGITTTTKSKRSKVTTGTYQPGMDDIPDEISAQDGPVPPDAFRWNGTLQKGCPGTAWRLLDTLWKEQNRTSLISDLADPVWRDHAIVPDENQVGHVRKKTNKFLNDHQIPFKVSKKGDYISLKEKQ